MLVRYFAAASASTGIEEERFDASMTLGDLASHLSTKYTVSQAPSAPPLSQLMERCSFLVNEVAQRDLGTELNEADVVDVLPPFAGG